MLWQIGWTGVHLFFVLSSYLITNLLLSEYYNAGKINFRRFFFRRALKIYPLYYLFILVSVLKNSGELLSSADYRLHLAGQIFHIQNYSGVLWYHTWSLAAEEQFYVGICLIIAFFSHVFKNRWLVKLGWLLGFMVVLVPLLRFEASMRYHTDWFMATHFIMDSFAVGAMLAMSRFVYPNLSVTLARVKHWLLLPVSLLLLPVFLLPAGNLFMNSLGMTMMYLAFALLIFYLVCIEDVLRSNNRASRLMIGPLVAIGLASYSIYLFHVPVKTIVDSIPLPYGSRLPVYFLGCIAMGKISWYLVERPIALYKSRSAASKLVSANA
jgi:peptidoglycan/LPS O-acetylase OafA/YrhL